MKKHLIEESILFISILKWVVIATGIGIIVGLSTAVFLKFSIGVWHRPRAIPIISSFCPSVY